MIHDPSAQRVSSCPVHFIWDGRGHGRMFVRSGFLVLIVACMMFTGRGFMMGPSVGPMFDTILLSTLALGGALWLSGQALTALTKRPTASHSKDTR